MTDRRQRVLRLAAAGVLFVPLVLAGTIGVWAQQEAADERVAKIKQSFQASMAALRSYEWIETTTVTLDGEQKSQKQNRCYYGADGKEQKVPVGDQAEEVKTKRGLRGRIVENKKEEFQEYVEKAMALVKQYLPPDPQNLQAVKDKGTQTLALLDDATRLRVTFPGYSKEGDALNVDVDPNADRIKGVSISTYIDDDPKDVIRLDVVFGVLEDGTTYPSKTTMHGESKKLDVVIENSGYRKTGS